ncbi:hypothetical protein ACFVMC_00445 [Nocardia sp. NPDC127579]|uniref:hypothetical protein n=1 Tax=Nocardia sp. NPDC127579 TaxID=3345402 RepID=UPI0036262511
MTAFVAPIRRKSAGRSHYYVDGAGTRMPGVTTILGAGVPKKALIDWAANATADYAVNNWETLGDLAVAARLNKLRKARYEERDAAANRGTQVHALAEQLVRGDTVSVPEELRGHVESYVRFLDLFDAEPVLIEFVVASYRFGYAGTADLIADLVMPGETDPVRWLLDIKTNRSGVYGETALQLAAYRHADVYLDADGAEQPMIPVERAGVVHVRADGFSLVPVTADQAQLRTFRYVQQIAAFVDESPALIGAPIDPPDADGEIARVVYERPTL